MRKPRRAKRKGLRPIKGKRHIAYFQIRYIYSLFSPCENLVSYNNYVVFLSIATDECGPSVGPGACKPSVGEGIKSRRLLVLTLSSFSVVVFSFHFCTFFGVCFK